ncbi:choice-of-anchor I family protein [Fortiea contorta]|uniref:choice-of-anchor I family protein n=1 Tax=Fortiea contorta TaxID=1892405 RepID=UPI00034912D3|nr:choice-of-anchor I family protein [Fortiea contorta]
MANLLQPNRIGFVKLDGAEISDFDPKSKRIFVTGEPGGKPLLQVIDAADPKNLKIQSLIDLSSLGGGIQSVAVRKATGTGNSIVAVAISATKATDPGKVVFYDASTLTKLAEVTVGALPDMLTFTPDGSKLLVANEGEPSEDYTIDPEGSISIIDVSGAITALDNSKVQTADFKAFNGQEASLRTAGVRIFGKLANGTNSTAAQDFEPEYIAVSPDGKTAFVTLQENNAFAIVDLATAKVTSVVPLGFKDHSKPGNGFDASDRDVDGTSSAGGKVNIQTWPVFGMYQPDGLASFQVGGKTYYISANEGDSRVRPTANGVFGNEGVIFNEETRVASLKLDPIAFPNASELQKPQNLGRLTVTNTLGDTDGDGDFDKIYAYGARSFSIWDDQGKLVFDSGDQFEQYFAKELPSFFNADSGNPAAKDTRSDNKGPEPESAIVGVINGKPYGFIALERAGGGVMVYDLSNPITPQFVQYVRTDTDISPEGLKFISAEDSPNGQPLLAVTNELSYTVSLYQIDVPVVPSDGSFQLQILHASDFEAGIPALDDAVRFSAVLNRLRTDPNLPSNVIANTLTLSSGDNYIPGAFLNASSDASLNNVGGLGVGTSVIGRGDIGILNALGIQASALGNHEFDLGVRQVRDILRPTGGNPGTNFPYLSTNLNFQPEITAGNLAASDLATNQTTAEASTIKNKLAKSTVITVAGNDGVLGTADDQKIGIVGATTPTLPNISSIGGIVVTPQNPTDFAALAAEIQSTVDVLTGQGINKVILLTHMQQINVERDELAPRLRNVDVIIAGGSNTLLSDANDILRAGDTSDGSYPIVKTAADGKPVLVVNTDGNYRYVGRLVTEFDKDGVINVSKLDNKINGAYATDEAGVDRVYGSDVNPRNVADSRVVAITDGLRNVISAKDNLIVGKSSVFLNGSREDVRTQETNFGNLTADANLWLARQIDPTVVISLKNGGGIRDNIGVVEAAPGAVDSNDIRKLPTQPNPLAPNKQTGDVSQLDVENSLRFNNDLSLVTVTAQQLRWIIEHGVAGTRPGATPGQFPQVAGINFSFDPTKTAIAFNNQTGEVTTQGDRIRSLTVVNTDGSPRDTIVQDGKLVGDPNRTFRIVTLNFLAGTTNANILGGDNYPFPKFIKDNPTLANRVDLRGENPAEDVNRNGKVDTALPLAPGAFTFAAAGSEQDAFAEYLKAVYGNTSYNIADKGFRTDNPRIVNLQSGTPTTRNTDNTFTLGINSNLRVTLKGVNSTGVNEIGVFTVDDNQNRINGIAPGSAAYTQEALKRGKVILSAIANNPQGYDPAQLSRIVSGLNSGSRLVFYLVQNGTTDGVLAGKNANVLFGTTAGNAAKVSNLGTNSYEIAWRDQQNNSVFNNLVVTVENTNSAETLGTRLQGQQERELIDLRGLTGQVKADFTVNREAGFNNFVGFYRVVDEKGGIDTNGDGTVDILPGQSGYTQAAVRGRVAGIDLTVANQGTASFTGKQLAGGGIFAPFIISNGTVEQVLSGQNNQVYFPYLGANPDKVDHISILGDNTFGFEDLAGGGDLDYNDIIVRANLSLV